MDRRRFVRRLVTPPIPGEGVLLVGTVAGVVGWGTTLVVFQFPDTAVVGTVTATLVAFWAVLTAVVVGAMVVYATPSVRRTTVWIVWAVLNAIATGVNLLGLARVLPVELLPFAFIHPWFAVIGAGYLTTALANPTNPRLRRSERGVYLAGGVASLLVLAGLFAGAVTIQAALVAGLLVHVLPMSFDVLIDVVRRSHHG